MTVSGLPSGVNAAVTVTMGSYSQTVTATTPLSGLAPGTYTVTPQTVTLRRNAFDGATSNTSVTVSANATASDAVTYALQPGDMWVSMWDGNSLTQYLGSSLSGTPATGTQITGLSTPYGAAFDLNPCVSWRAAGPSVGLATRVQNVRVEQPPE